MPHEHILYSVIVSNYPANDEYLNDFLRALRQVVEYFFGSPPTEAILSEKTRLVSEVVGSLTKLPLLSVAGISNGELVGHVRTVAHKPELQPFEKNLSITITEEVLLLITADKVKCKINGTVSVVNPLANDLVLRVKLKIPFERAGSRVPWTPGDDPIPVQLGRYELCHYTSDKCPFEVTLDHASGSIRMIWRSNSLSDEARVFNCQLELECEGSPTRLDLDPPTLSHAASYDSTKHQVKWQFFHLVPSTLYTLSLGGLRVRSGKINFRIDNALVSGQAFDQFEVVQASSGINAFRQMTSTHYSHTSSTYHHINFQ